MARRLRFRLAFSVGALLIALGFVGARPAAAQVFNPETFTLRQRPSGGGDLQPPLADHRAHGVVPHRRRRRGLGQIGHRAFPRASDVPRHASCPAGRVLEDRRAQRRQRQRVHQLRLHRLFPERVARPARTGHGARIRPHGRPRADRRGRQPGARRDPRGAPPGRREPAGLAAARADERRAVPQPSLRAADHRLGARDARPDARGRNRVVPRSTTRPTTPS